jgi:hypothetical protein
MKRSVVISALLLVGCQEKGARTQAVTQCDSTSVRSLGDDVASAVLSLGSSADQIAMMTTCGSQEGPASLIIFEDARCAVTLTTLHGANTWTLRGPRPRTVELLSGSERRPSLHLVVKEKANAPLPTWLVEFRNNACTNIGPFRAQVIHRMGRFWAEWLVSPVLDPSEQWECRDHDNCKSHEVCAFQWREWSEPRKAWRGLSGKCVPGIKCTRDADCGGAGACQVEVTFSAATGKAQKPHCQRF